MRRNMSSDRFHWRQWLVRQGNGGTIWPKILPAKFDLTAVNVAEGLREGIGIAAPVLVGELINQPILAWAAVAAFYTCLIDPGGSFRARFSAMTTLGVLGAASCAIALSVFQNMWLVVALGFILSFCTSFVRIYGDAAQKVGLFILVAFVVASGSFDAMPAPPMEAAAVFFGGTLWAMLLTLGLWPVHPHGPVRRSLFVVYNHLSAYAAALVRLNSVADFSPDQWGTVTRDSRRQIREALDAARSAVANIGRTRPGKSSQTDKQLMFLQCADEIFASLIALGDFIEARGTEAPGCLPSAVALALEQTPDLLQGLAATVISRTKPLPLPLQVKLDTTLELVSTNIPMADEKASEDAATKTYRHLVATILSFVRIAAVVTSPPVHPSGPASSASAPQAPTRTWDDTVLPPLRENLNLDAIALRHALRLAVAAAISLFISGEFAFVHGYWLTMTVVLILQPYLGTTWQITAKRIVFSSLGGLLAAGLTFVVHTPVSIALCVFPLAIATMIFRPIDYGLFVMCLTPQFVLISSLTDPLHSDLRLAGERAFDSVLGGVLVLLVGVLLWPRQRHRELGEQLAAAISANRNYLSAILDVQRYPATSNSVDALRRLAGLASNNAEAILERMLAEPGTDPVTTESVMTAVTTLRRLTGTVTLLSLLPGDVLAELRSERANAMIVWIVQSLKIVAETAASTIVGKPLCDGINANDRSAQPGPDGAGSSMTDEILSRIVGQIVVLQSAMERLARSTALNYAKLTTFAENKR